MGVCGPQVDKYKSTIRFAARMDLKVLTIAALFLMGGGLLAAVAMMGNGPNSTGEDGTGLVVDPLIQSEDHDHKQPSEHNFSSDNMEFASFNPLTSTGNAEIQVMTAPDGRVYTYQAGWNDVHIIDVTDPTNTTVVGVYHDPNTQVLDLKYIEWSGAEYIITQNQLVDPGYTEPNVGEWGDPMQVSVNLIDVTDKTDPQWIDSWYDVDHPSGPHNLYTQMIDNEWYILVANPDYEECDVGQGDACGGITIAHINFDLQNSLPRIVKVGEAEVAWETTRGGWIYIHDMTSQTWPGTDSDDPRYGRTYIYGAYWEAGLRIFDISDVPHPTNSPAEYLWHGSLCRASGGSQAGCNWRAPEVGHWDDFSDLDGDGQPDSQTTGNVNGGRASYIHYAEPFPEMVDTEHLGGPPGERHLTILAVEVLSTQFGTGLVYLLDTTNYTMNNGALTFQPSLYSHWEIPTGQDHCFGGDCPSAPNGDEWLLFSPHNLDSVYFPTGDEGFPDNSLGGDWDGRLYVSSYHAGLWILDVETLIAAGYSGSPMNDTNLDAVVAFYLPNEGEPGQPLESQFYDFAWAPYLWTAEYHDGYTYMSCITNGLFVAQLDIDAPYRGVLMNNG
jgi:hypothetical protein